MRPPVQNAVMPVMFWSSEMLRIRCGPSLSSPKQWHESQAVDLGCPIIHMRLLALWVRDVENHPSKISSNGVCMIGKRTCDWR